jgi:hypothetical protein
MVWATISYMDSLYLPTDGIVPLACVHLQILLLNHFAVVLCHEQIQAIYILRQRDQM